MKEVGEPLHFNSSFVQYCFTSNIYLLLSLLNGILREIHLASAQEAFYYDTPVEQWSAVFEAVESMYLTQDQYDGADGADKTPIKNQLKGLYQRPEDIPEKVVKLQSNLSESIRKYNTLIDVAEVDQKTLKSIKAPVVEKDKFVVAEIRDKYDFMGKKFNLKQMKDKLKDYISELKDDIEQFEEQLQELDAI